MFVDLKKTEARYILKISTGSPVSRRSLCLCWLGSASVFAGVHRARSMDPLRITHHGVLPGAETSLTRVSARRERTRS